MRERMDECIFFLLKLIFFSFKLSFFGSILKREICFFVTALLCNFTGTASVQKLFSYYFTLHFHIKSHLWNGMRPNYQMALAEVAHLIDYYFKHSSALFIPNNFETKNSKITFLQLDHWHVISSWIPNKCLIFKLKSLDFFLFLKNLLWFIKEKKYWCIFIRILVEKTIG